MNIPLLDKRVRSLEEMMADLIAVSTQTSIEMAAFKEEMREDRRKSAEEMREFKEQAEEDRRSFKEEMQQDRRNSKLEMAAFKEEMREDRRNSKIEMAAFKEEMREDRRNSKLETAAFKQEMREFRDKMDRDSQERKLEQLRFNRELGDIAHKQGRMAEDLVSPSICRILREIFHVPEIYKCAANVRYKQIHPEDRGRIKEFDVVAVCGDYVLVVETKSSPVSKDIPKLLKTLGVFREYFPEHRDKKVFGGLAMLYAPKNLIDYASSEGLLILAVGEELMDVMNEPGFKPSEF